MDFSRQKILLSTVSFTKNQLRRYQRIIVALIFLVFIFTGYAGLDFGKHWDEWVVRWTQQEMVVSGNILPRSYLYPTMQHRIASLPLVPTMVKEAYKSFTAKFSKLPQIHRERRTELRAYAASHRMHMITRGFFLTFSALGLIWIFLALRNLGFSKTVAVTGPALLGFSWEYAYHARFMVGDTLMVQFAIMALAAMLYAYRTGKLQWFKYAAAAAAAATSAKYQGAIVLLPLLLLLWSQIRTSASGHKLRTFAMQSMKIFIWFTGAFILCMPEIILDSYKVLEQFKHNMGLYSSGCYGYTIEPGLTHMTKNMHYLLWHLFSPYALPSLLFFVIAACGILPLIKSRKWELLAALTVTPLILFFLFSTKRVMFVRNLLLIFPFLIILAVYGLQFILEQLKRTGICLKIKGIFIPGILLTVLFLFHALFLCQAAASIRIKQDKPFLQELHGFLKASPEKYCLVSPQLYRKLQSAVPEVAGNITTNTRTPADYIAYSHEELGQKTSWKVWKANSPGSVVKVFGPMEINYFYYTTWLNHRHRFIVAPKRIVWNYPYIRKLFQPE